jgi:hypothetical protein
MISASRLPLLQHCAYTARPGVVLPIEAGSSHAARGNARHALYQHLHEARFIGGDFRDIEACELADPQGHIDQVMAWIEGHVPADALAEIPFAFDPARGGARALPSRGHRDYSAATPGEIVGTADLVWAEAGPEPVGVVLDWKTGRARHVDAVHDNAQMAFLALAASRAFNHNRVRVILAFVDDDGGVTTEQSEYTLAGLAGVARWLAALAAAIPQAQAVSGPHCRAKYCPLLGLCPATGGDVAAVIDAPSEAVDLTVHGHESAARLYFRALAAGAYHDKAMGVVKAFAEKHGPIAIGGGSTYGPRTTERETLRMTPQAEAHLLTQLGPELFERTCPRTTTKTALAQAAKASGVPLSDLLGVLRVLGAATTKTVVTYEETAS